MEEEKTNNRPKSDHLLGGLGPKRNKRIIDVSLDKRKFRYVNQPKKQHQPPKVEDKDKTGKLSTKELKFIVGKPTKRVGRPRKYLPRRGKKGGRSLYTVEERNERDQKLAEYFLKHPKKPKPRKTLQELGLEPRPKSARLQPTTRTTTRDTRELFIAYQEYLQRERNDNDNNQNDKQKQYFFLVQHCTDALKRAFQKVLSIPDDDDHDVLYYLSTTSTSNNPAATVRPDFRTLLALYLDNLKESFKSSAALASNLSKSD